MVQMVLMQGVTTDTGVVKLQQFSSKGQLLNVDDKELGVKISSYTDILHFRPKSVFLQRTEESSASQYFQFYGYLNQQQNMNQNYVRTTTYQKAILGNLSDFHAYKNVFPWSFPDY